LDCLPDELALGAPTAGRLAKAIQRAYLARMASHDPEIGDDAYTYGTGLWRSTWYFLEKEFGDQAHRPYNAFFIRFDEYDLYFYGDRRRGSGHRVIGGSSVQDHILDANEQFAFEFVPGDKTNGRPNLVGLHVGSSPLGLTQLHIGLPVAHDDPNTAWKFLDLVYLNTGSPDPTNKSDLPSHRPFRDLQAPELDVQPEFEGESEADGTSL
jgi:hypothetical protein